MGNKIIIDEEVLAKLDAEKADITKLRDDALLEGDLESYEDYNRQIYGLIVTKHFLLENSTTISIDESIEDKFPSDKFIEDSHAKMINISKSVGFVNGAKWMRDKLKQGATEQSIISEIKSKEKDVRPFPCMNDKMCEKQCGVCGYVQDKLTNP